jgi:hypothetical protein
MDISRELQRKPIPLSDLPIKIWFERRSRPSAKPLPQATHLGDQELIFEKSIEDVDLGDIKAVSIFFPENDGHKEFNFTAKAKNSGDCKGLCLGIDTGCLQDFYHTVALKRKC